MDRKVIVGYVDSKLKTKLQREAKKKKMSESEFIKQAVRAKLGLKV